MGNDKKNDNGVPNAVKFTQDYQPTPEAKSKGWQRKLEAQKIMDEILNLTSMSYKEVKDLMDDIQANPEKHTLREVKLANYLMERKYTVDYLDRHISKAPQEVDVTSKGEKIESVVVKFIHGNNETSNGSNGDSGEDDTTREEV